MKFLLVLLAVVAAALAAAQRTRRAAGAPSRRPTPPAAGAAADAAPAPSAACTCRATRRCPAAAACSAATRTARATSGRTRRHERAARSPDDRPLGDGAARVARRGADESSSGVPRRRRRGADGDDESWFGALGADGSTTRPPAPTIADFAAAVATDASRGAAATPRRGAARRARRCGADHLRAHLPRVHRARAPRSASRWSAALGRRRRRSALRPTPRSSLLSVGYAALAISTVAAAALPARGAARGAGAPAQPAVARDDRRRPGLLHRRCTCSPRRRASTTSRCWCCRC